MLFLTRKGRHPHHVHLQFTFGISGISGFCGIAQLVVGVPIDSIHSINVGTSPDDRDRGSSKAQRTGKGSAGVG